MPSPLSLLGFTSWKGREAFPLSLVVFVLGLIATRIIVVIFDLE